MSPSTSNSRIIPARNLVLVGYRGSGKTQVGLLLARQSGWQFVDTDRLVEQAAGCTISEIFARSGETTFRNLESQAIADAVDGAQRVISVGGGGVLREENRQRLAGAGVCCWLTAPPGELARRMAADPRHATTRPPLTDRDPTDEIVHLLKQREPLYAALADHVIDTTGQSVEQVAEAVLAALHETDQSADAS